MSLRNKKMINYHIILKGFIKQPIMKQSPALLSFFLINCYVSVFSLNLSMRFQILKNL